MGWIRNAINVLMPVIKPTWVRLKANLCASSGRSGRTKDWKKSPIKWTRNRAKIAFLLIWVDSIKGFLTSGIFDSAPLTSYSVLVKRNRHDHPP